MLAFQQVSSTGVVTKDAFIGALLIADARDTFMTWAENWHKAHSK